jgi:hypothetical protein
VLHLRGSVRQGPPSGSFGTSIPEVRGLCATNCATIRPVRRLTMEATMIV